MRGVIWARKTSSSRYRAMTLRTECLSQLLVIFQGANRSQSLMMVETARAKPQSGPKPKPGAMRNRAYEVATDGSDKDKESPWVASLGRQRLLDPKPWTKANRGRRCAGAATWVGSLPKGRDAFSIALMPVPATHFARASSLAMRPLTGGC